MNLNINISKESHIEWLTVKSAMKIAMISIIMLTGFLPSSDAQIDKYNKPTWWFGAAAAANFNYYRGSTHQLNADFTPPVTFHNGQGIGLYIAPLIEYHHPSSGWGLMLQAGYDGRGSNFDQVISDCDCPADLSTNLSYISLEPSLRFAPGNSNFYLYFGPRFAFTKDKSFTYKLGLNPNIPTQEPTPDVNGDLNNVNNTLISAQIGAGYDIPLNSRNHQLQAILSPFVSFQPYFGQSPRNVETWNITTIRAGAALKFGRGSLRAVSNTVMNTDDVRFTVYSPKNIPSERTINESFPLRNYVFFDLGSNEISDRYVLINKNQAKDFKETQPDVFKPKNLSGRSEREMTIYYNLLNIIGERMVKNPTSTINLVGSSEKGIVEGTTMAESVRKYISGVFDIDTSRIKVEGRNKPKIPSEQPGGTLELDLLREGDRRVSIESNSPSLLMEFENGKNAFLKPVQISGVQNAPLDSYVSFNVEGAKNVFSSWSLEIKDKKGNIRYFGPYTQDIVYISGKTLLVDQQKAEFDITMTGIRKDGSTIRKNVTSNITLMTPSKNDEGMRYSILYEFNDAKAINIYEKYLKDIVTPKIPVGSKVIIHGYTDIIGNEVNNYELSLARAHDVHKIIQSSLTKAGRTDVTFDIYGFGEDPLLSPFDNKYPEERFYNRTVIVDIIPKR